MGERSQLMLPRRKRRLPPKPPDPPQGMMWLYWRLVPIEDAEEHAKNIMGNFDELPRKQRDLLNYRHVLSPSKTRKKRRSHR
jgi:hypothetical protein